MQEIFNAVRLQAIVASSLSASGHELAHYEKKHLFRICSVMALYWIWDFQISLYANLSFRRPKQQINLRLLWLLTQPLEGNIDGSLDVYDFDENCPEYIAISYATADTTDTAAIRVNDQDIWVGLHCCAAL